MASETSANLALPYLAAAQAQKHVTHNEALRALDAQVHLRLESLTALTPPAAPAEGARWFVPVGASGVFAGHAGRIAAYEAGAWDVLPCVPGTLAYVADQRRLRLFDGTAWVSPLASAARGGMLEAVVLEEDVFLFGTSVATTTVIPARAVVIGVSTRTLETVTGATAYHCGIAGEPSAFGGSLGAAAGNTNAGVIGPRAFYTDTPVVLTAQGAAFTGGQVRVAIHYLLCAVPGASGGGYVPARAETVALVARMPAPAPSRQYLMDRLVGALVDAGVWAKLDALYVLAAPDSASARVNWVSAAYGLTEVNSPAFSADRGYRSDGATSHLRTGFVPSGATRFRQASASLGVWVAENGRRGLTIGALQLPGYQGSHIARYGAGDGDYCALTINQTGIIPVVNYSAFLDPGFYAATRTDSASVVRYRNGALVESVSAAASAPSTLEFYLLAINAGGTPYVNGTSRVSAAFIGGGLTAAEVAALDAALRAYLTALGA